MQYCKKCIIPSTRPEQVFKDGECDACRSTSEKNNEIDWNKRALEFEEILKKYRSDGSTHDCIIPVSGGKDSCYQAIVMREKYKMNPLCVNFIPCQMSEVGQRNLDFLRDQGFDLLQLGMNRKVYKKLSRIGFEKLGDGCWPEHIGIYTYPIQVAVKYNIPLVIYGENCQFEYGGPENRKNTYFTDRNWLEQFLMHGYRLSDTVHDGVDMNDLKMLHYPNDDELKKLNLQAVWLGHFEKWDTMRNLEECLSRGWEKNPDGPLEGCYNDFENLDCIFIGRIREYMKFVKYGFGRATDQLNIEVRAGRMTRNDAIDALKNTSEGKIPRKFMKEYCEFMNMTEGEVYEVIDRFTNRRLFECDEEGNLLRDHNGDLIRKFFPVKL